VEWFQGVGSEFKCQYSKNFFNFVFYERNWKDESWLLF
jgi:uncharacterized protein with von Willebrand factor type A (vWA) domain